MLRSVEGIYANSLERRLQREQFWITKLQTPKGLNIDSWDLKLELWYPYETVFWRSCSLRITHPMPVLNYECVCARAHVRVRACVCVCVRACVLMCVSLARDSSETVQTWHGDCLRHENASRVTYIDLDHHSRSHISKSWYIFDYFRNYSSNTHQVCCEGSPTKGLYDHC